MKQVAIERLSINKVFLGRENYLILGRTVVGTFVLLKTDRTDPFVLGNHLVERCKLEHLTFLHRDDAVLV